MSNHNSKANIEQIITNNGSTQAIEKVVLETPQKNMG